MGRRAPRGLGRPSYVIGVVLGHPAPLVSPPGRTRVMRIRFAAGGWVLLDVIAAGVADPGSGGVGSLALGGGVVEAEGFGDQPAGRRTLSVPYRPLGSLEAQGVCADRGSRAAAGSPDVHHWGGRLPWWRGRCVVMVDRPYLGKE